MTHIIIFAKAPIAGFAKTRLIPVLGAKGAGQLAQQLLGHALVEALAVERASIELCVTPAINDPLWHSVSLPEGVSITDQGEGDLGQRMARASQRALLTHTSIIIMGTDCPGLDRVYLHQAIERLHRTDACITPVEDGGYALIGLKKYRADIFNDIPWSTDSVCAITLKRFEQLAWHVAILPALYDIDEASDLKHLDEKRWGLINSSAK